MTLTLLGKTDPAHRYVQVPGSRMLRTAQAGPSAAHGGAATEPVFARSPAAEGSFQAGAQDDARAPPSPSARLITLAGSVALGQTRSPSRNPRLNVRLPVSEGTVQRFNAWLEWIGAVTARTRYQPHLTGKMHQRLLKCYEASGIFGTKVLSFRQSL